MAGHETPANHGPRLIFFQSRSGAASPEFFVLSLVTDLKRGAVLWRLTMVIDPGRSNIGMS